MKVNTRIATKALRELNPAKDYKTATSNAWGYERQIIERDHKSGKWLHVAPIHNGLADIRLLPDVVEYLSEREG